MACLRVLRAYANFDTTRMLLSKSSRCCSPSPTALVCGRVLEPDRISRFVTLVSGARSSVRAGLKRSSGGVVGSWDLFVSPKLDAVRSKVSVGDKHLASSGVRHVSGIGRSCAEHGEMGSTSAVAANGGVETAAKPRRYAVLTTANLEKYGMSILFWKVNSQALKSCRCTMDLWLLGVGMTLMVTRSG